MATSIIPSYTVPRHLLTEVNVSTRFNKESAVRNFTILYDNGKKFKVGSPTNTNVRDVTESGKLTYTKHSGNIKTDFTICMSDVAALQITSVNGDISLRKFKDCAKFNVNMSKK